MSPELLRGESVDGMDGAIKTDTFSFAVTLWAVLSREKPYADLPRTQGLQEHVLAGGRPPIPSGGFKGGGARGFQKGGGKEGAGAWPDKVVALLQACWDEDPQQRPHFDLIVQLLEKELLLQREREGAHSGGQEHQLEGRLAGGDVVEVLKEGRQKGQRARVTMPDADQDGKLQVRMLTGLQDGKLKSYLRAEVQLLPAGGRREPEQRQEQAQEAQAQEAQAQEAQAQEAQAQTRQAQAQVQEAQVQAPAPLDASDLNPLAPGAQPAPATGAAAAAPSVSI
jgi:hypothetical protein